MNQRDDLDRMLAAWLDDPYTPPAPRYLAEVLEETRRTRQRPAWASLERWLPMALVTPRPATSMLLRVAWILIITVAVIALTVGVVIVGSRLLAPAVAIPQGGAAVIAFGSYAGGLSGQSSGDVYTVRADGTELRQLTSGPQVCRRVALQRGGIGPPLMGDQASGPRWSQDGTLLAVSGADGLVVVGADGSGERLVAADGFAPTWSPDGTKLAFYRTVDPSEYFDERPCTVRMWVVDAAGGGEQRLEPLADGCGAAPAWSPDGTRLAGAFIVSTEAEPDLAFHLAVVTIDGSEAMVVLQDAAGTWQPFAVPLPPAPSFPAVSPAP